MVTNCPWEVAVTLLLRLLCMKAHNPTLRWHIPQVKTAFFKSFSLSLSVNADSKFVVPRSKFNVRLVLLE
jgi:hypothetical protein